MEAALATSALMMSASRCSSEIFSMTPGCSNPFQSNSISLCLLFQFDKNLSCLTLIAVVADNTISLHWKTESPLVFFKRRPLSIHRTSQQYSYKNPHGGFYWCIAYAFMDQVTTINKNVDARFSHFYCTINTYQGNDIVFTFESNFSECRVFILFPNSLAFSVRGKGG